MPLLLFCNNKYNDKILLHTRDAKKTVFFPRKGNFLLKRTFFQTEKDSKRISTPLLT